MYLWTGLENLFGVAKGGGGAVGASRVRVRGVGGCKAKRGETGGLSGIGQNMIVSRTWQGLKEKQECCLVIEGGSPGAEKSVAADR